MWPNPSLEWTATGKPLGPRASQCHHPSRGPSAFPASAPSAQTLGFTGHLSRSPSTLKPASVIDPQSMHSVSGHWLLSRSKSLVRLVVRALAWSALIGTVFGCSDEPPSPVVRLEVSASGAYSLAGQSVASTELTKQLQALRSQQPRVELHVLADRSANYQSVGAAITAAQAAQISKLRVGTLPEAQK